ncbi:MAG: PDZ domain-containing protein [Caldilineaceae bacterium]
MLLVAGLLWAAPSPAGAVYAAELSAPVGQAEPAEPGVLIAAVLPEGPAAAAGVKRGMVLLRVNETTVNSMADLQKVLDTAEPGRDVALTVLYGDDERTITVTLGDEAGRAFLGVRLCCDDVVFDWQSAPSDPFRPGGRQQFDFTFPSEPGLNQEDIAILAGGGAHVVEIVADGPAAQAGLQQGDIIVAVDGVPIDQENELSTLIQRYQPGDVVTLDVQRGGEIHVQRPAAGNQPEENAPKAAEELAQKEADDNAEDIVRFFRLTSDSVQIEVTLGAHPDDPKQAYLGIQYVGMMAPAMEGFSVMPAHPFALPGEYGGALPGYPPMPPAIIDGSTVISQGVVILEVLGESPAAAAGLAEQEVILSIDGEEIDTPQIMVDIIANHQSGDTVELTVQPPKAEPRTVEVVLGEGEQGGAFLGVRVGLYHQVRILGDHPLPFAFPEQFRWEPRVPQPENYQNRFGGHSPARAHLRALLLELLHELMHDGDQHNWQAPGQFRWQQQPDFQRNDGRSPDAPSMFRFFPSDPTQVWYDGDSRTL